MPSMDSEATSNAHQCINIAKTAWNEGNREKAIKFAKKSLRFAHTDEAAALLSRFESQPGGPRQRPAASSSQTQSRPASSTASETKNYTPEEQALAKRICQTKDYYQLLGVQRSANEKEIKSAFRKVRQTPCVAPSRMYAQQDHEKARPTYLRCVWFSEFLLPMVDL